MTRQNSRELSLETLFTEMSNQDSFLDARGAFPSQPSKSGEYLAAPCATAPRVTTSMPRYSGIMLYGVEESGHRDVGVGFVGVDLCEFDARWEFHAAYLSKSTIPLSPTWVHPQPSHDLEYMIATGNEISPDADPASTW